MSGLRCLGFGPGERGRHGVFSGRCFKMCFFFLSSFFFYGSKYRSRDVELGIRVFWFPFCIRGLGVDLRIDFQDQVLLLLSFLCIFRNFSLYFLSELQGRGGRRYVIGIFPAACSTKLLRVPRRRDPNCATLLAGMVERIIKHVKVSFVQLALLIVGALPAMTTGLRRRISTRTHTIGPGAFHPDEKCRLRL